jgi:hypothetical protein
VTKQIYAFAAEQLQNAESEVRCCGIRDIEPQWISQNELPKATLRLEFQTV